MSGGKYIATRLHRAAELSNDPFFDEIANLPHYVIDKSLMELLARSDVTASITAMLEAGIAKLPFPEMLIELETEPRRSFIRLYEYMDGFRAEMAAMHDRDGAIIIDPFPYSIDFNGDGFTASSADPRSFKSWVEIAVVGLCIAMLMLNIQGVEKTAIDAQRLNKQRVASGKPSIPKHTLMHIAFVYDRHGTRHAVGTDGGRLIAMHLRAGYTRRQHFGKDNAEEKTVYIAPVIVNFKPGAELQQPRKIIAA